MFCPEMAMSGSKRRNSAASAQGQEADIAVLAIDPHVQGYGNLWFSVKFTQLHVGAVNLFTTDDWTKGPH